MSAKKVFLVLLSTALGIVALHFLFHPVRIWGWDTSLFYMDEKFTFAAYFTTIVWFLAGWYAIQNIHIPRGSMKYIEAKLIALFFFFLSFDEYFETHEYGKTLLMEYIDMESWIGTLTRSSWVFPFIVLILFVLAMFLRFTLSMQDKHVKRLMFTGSAMYVAVLILEVFGGSMYGHPAYLIFVGLEEGTEMVSASVFLYAMMRMEKIY